MRLEVSVLVDRRARDHSPAARRRSAGARCSPPGKSGRAKPRSVDASGIPWKRTSGDDGDVRDRAAVGAADEPVVGRDARLGRDAHRAARRRARSGGPCPTELPDCRWSRRTAGSARATPLSANDLPYITGACGGGEREDADPEPRRAQVRARGGRPRRSASTRPSRRPRSRSRRGLRGRSAIVTSSSRPGTLSTALSFVGRNDERSPVVVGRKRVVRIVDRHEVRNGARLPDVGDRRSAAARRGEEVRGGDLPAVREDLARGRVHGRGRRRRLVRSRRRTPGCACRGRRRTTTRGLAHRERVRARGDGLRLQRLRKPVFGISDGTTAYRYCSSAHRVDARRAPCASDVTVNVPRYGVGRRAASRR